MSRHTFTDQHGTQWTVGYDAATASYFADDAVQRVHVAGADGAEHDWLIEWDDDAREFDAAPVGGSDGEPVVGSLADVLDGLGGSISDEQRDVLAQLEERGPRELGATGRLDTFGHLEDALAQHDVRLPQELRVTLEREQPADPLAAREHAHERVARAAADLSAAERAVRLAGTGLSSPDDGARRPTWPAPDAWPGARPTPPPHPGLER